MQVKIKGVTTRNGYTLTHKNIKKGRFKDMTKRQKEIIKDNLNAYIANFGYIVIECEECGKGF